MKLNFRSYNFTTKAEEGNTLIFDIIRRKFVRLNPEEWVRQHVLHYLTEDLGVPKGLISVERSLVYNGMQKRFDVAVAGSDGRLRLLIECKAPSVKLSAATLKQAGIYHKTLGVDGIFLSNGLQHIFMQWSAADARFEISDQIPPFRDWL